MGRLPHFNVLDHFLCPFETLFQELLSSFALHRPINLFSLHQMYRQLWIVKVEHTATVYNSDCAYQFPMNMHGYTMKLTTHNTHLNQTKLIESFDFYCAIFTLVYLFAFSLSLALSMCISVSVLFCAFPLSCSLVLSIFQLFSLYPCRWRSLSLCLSVCLPACLFFFLSFFLCAYLSVPHSLPFILELDNQYLIKGRH